MPEAGQLNSLYEKSWSSPEKNVTETGGTTPELAADYVAWLMRSLNRRDLCGLRILEYGAGRGELLQAVQSSGAEVWAVEPYGLDYLHQRGFHAYSSLQDLPENLRFDGIVTVDVVEHDVTAWNMVRELAARLTPHGWLFVATPNPTSLNARIFRSRWREALKPGHLLFFEPEGLENLFQNAGFRNWRRLHWRIHYAKSAIVRAKDAFLSAFGLDGELRYLAFRSEPE